MVSRHGCRMGVTAAALALVTLAGCQSSGGRAVRPPIPLNEASPTLTVAQRADVKIALGRSMESSGDFDGAISVYTEAIAADPKRVDAQLRLAALQERQGRVAEARECYRKALAQDPTNADVYCNVGYSLYLQQDWQQATDFLNHALKLKPNHARAHNNLGLVLARQGQTDGALAEFMKAGCNNADAQANLAYCLMLDGNTTQARQHYETALQLDPACVPARRALQDLKLLVAHQQTAAPGAMAAVSAPMAPLSLPVTPVAGTVIPAAVTTTPAPGTVTPVSGAILFDSAAYDGPSELPNVSLLGAKPQPPK